MGMRLRRYAGKTGSVLILDTGGGAPDRREWQLMCCRSLTLPVDTLLLGPLGAGSPYRVMALDTDGLTTAVTRREAEVFALFLRDEGYVRERLAFVTDGRGVFAVPTSGEGWWALSAPEGLRLERLLGL